MKPVIFAFLVLITTSHGVGPSRGDTAKSLDKPDQCSLGVTNCSTCLQKPGCIWCADTQVGDAIQPRCKNSFSPKECTSKVEFKPKKPQSSGSHKYISPKSIKASVRRDVSVSLNLTYTPSNYPVDLYILLDLSQSMEKHKDKLSILGSKIAKEMEGITEDFRLGFGSFVDKTVLPYARPLKKDEKATLVEPYGFKHHLSLTHNASLFEKKVKETKMSTNIDSPEGGLEALVQAMVCNEIGWRNYSRKLIILATDADFHSAGDGKLAGILVPNDLKCHLSPIGNSGEYIYDWINKHDYPSIGQLNFIASEYRTTIIFAAIDSKYNVYKELAEEIEGASAAKLTEDSDNIVEVVKEQYKKISGTVKLQDENRPDHISLTYHAKCNSTSEFEKKDLCEDVKTGDVLEFKVDVTLTKCEGTNKVDTFAISPVGVQERVEVEITSMCQCPCEKDREPNSTSCTGRGDLVCGICQCASSFSGNICECDLGEGGSKVNQCKASGNEMECGGRGVCNCGKCQCISRYSGTYCECDNESCERYNSELCSGESHGKCECGKCNCHPDWSGDKCECSTKADKCRRPGSSQLCSGKGECECNKCVCGSNEQGRYQGAYCEKCPGCDNECSKYEYSLYCSVFDNSPIRGGNCLEFQPRLNFTWTNITDKMPGEEVCRFMDKDDCAYVFFYSNTPELSLRMVKIGDEERECPKPADLVTIAGSTLAVTLLIGLALILLWRLLTYLHDKKEYAKFEEEKARAKWANDSNPIYKGPTSEFKNPAYAKK